MNTRPIGIYNYANSYRQAALALREAKAPGTHPESPVLFLMNHAVELYLKAYLHAKGISERDLSKRPYSHNLIELIWAAKQRGLTPKEETYSVVRVLNLYSTQTTSRYIETRVYRPIRDDALDRAALDLHKTAGLAMRRMGFSMRI